MTNPFNYTSAASPMNSVPLVELKEEPDIIIDAPYGYDAPLFNWNPDKTSTKMTLANQNTLCTSNTGSGFKTTVGTQAFLPGGRYYFQIFLHKGNLVKIGVCRSNIVNIEQAFCDTKDGWGIYNGELRHNSNSTGPKYGSQLKVGDVIGVALDMVDGTLSYYRNGENWGVAFNDPELKLGEFVAAVSLIYKNDVFSLRTMIKQD